MDNRLKHIPLAFFALFCLKFLILNTSSYVDASLLLVSGLLCAFYELKTDNKKIAYLESKLKSQEDELISQQKKIDEIKVFIASSKLGANLRPMTNQR